MTSANHAPHRLSRAVIVLLATLLLAAVPSFAQAPAGEPKVKLAPRPLPGTTSRPAPATGPAATPETPPDPVKAEAEARASIPWFGASGQNDAPRAVAREQVITRTQAQPEPGTDRARILYVHRRGTIEIPPKPVEAPEAAMESAAGPSASGNRPEPAPLAPGQIRIIPRELVNVQPQPPRE